MYNDNYNYNTYGEHSEPPRNKRPRRKGWLIVMVIVAAVVIVSSISIEGYKFIESLSAKTEEPLLEWKTEEEPPTVEEEKEPVEKDEQAAPETAAKEGTSASYALENKPSAGLLDQAPEIIAAEVTPSVVCIQNYVSVTYQTSQGGFFRGFGGLNFQEPEFATEIRLNGEGSGIILTEDGYISTNAHVVSGADLIKVVLSDDTLYEATLVGIDTDTDLAVIKIDAQGLTPAELGNSEELNVGQYVMAIGNPGGLEFSSTVTLGIVSAVNRPLQLEENGYSMNTIQTDAAINPGNSGGALVNMNGQVIGINSAKYAATGYEGLGFAISINEALPIIKDLMDYGKVMGRSMLGVSGIMLDDLTAEHYNLVEGFYIYELENPNAGTLRAGDIITKINDTKVTADNVIKNALKDIEPGESITVEYYRSQDGSTGTTTLTLMEYNE